ncbi:MAG: translation initiation factor IF-1 [Mycoplasma sp.]
MMSQDKINVKGTIKEVIQGGKFKVTLENGLEIVALVSGKMRVNKISILPGDAVEVELSPYDLTKGRITYRHH